MTDTKHTTPFHDSMQMVLPEIQPTVALRQLLNHDMYAFDAHNTASDMITPARLNQLAIWHKNYKDFIPKPATLDAVSDLSEWQSVLQDISRIVHPDPADLPVPDSAAHIIPHNLAQFMNEHRERVTTAVKAFQQS